MGINKVSLGTKFVADLQLFHIQAGAMFPSAKGFGVCELIPSNNSYSGNSALGIF